MDHRFISAKPCQHGGPVKGGEIVGKGGRGVMLPGELKGNLFFEAI